MKSEDLPPHIKPSPDVCPEQFCFQWLERGNRFAPGVYDSLKDSFSEMREVTESHCGMRYFPGKRVCRREVNDPDNRDYYEPVEPYLERIGLPWFYFIADAKVQDWDPEERRQYEDYFGAREIGEDLTDELLGSTKNEEEI